ncbi:hypothetical protein ACIBHY_40550 [Nonomuraea sp. NPDC050547]|uniref:TRAFAC clade GTPase domain-containing protein n=1 Tax=Nonomuraea sp. NPDC050547 TaxID=3364368 RepID=UPI0037935981
MWGFLFLAALWLAAVMLAVFVAVMIFPVVLLAGTVIAVGIHLLYVHATLFPDHADGPSPVMRPDGSAGRDPAYRHYLVGQVWKDWRAIVRGTMPRVVARAEKAVSTATRVLVGGEQAWFLFPLWIGVVAGIVAAFVPAGLIALFVVAMYLVAIVLGLLGWLACVAVLRALEQVFMVIRRILQTCPYPGCYARFTLPVYACSTCGARHARLTPDTNGAARHVCRCGTRLPTTILLGRYRLQALCPVCDRQLPTRVGRVRIEPLPFAGGPDAGKTTFMALAVDAVHSAVNTAGGSVLFAQKSDEQAFRNLRRELSAGRVSKTLPDLPKAVMLDVALPGGTGGKRILYLFDPSGEHYTGASKIEEMRYLSHGEALILIIDPFALPEVQDHLLESERKALTAKGVMLSREDPADTFNRLRNELAGRADGGKQRRVAVVLTKADLLKQTTSGRGIEEVRAWLTLMGLGNLVRELDHQGAQVRYLSSGLPPDSGRIAEMLGWLTGLRLSADLGDASAQELTTGDARRPWEVRPRLEGRPPLSYLVFRRALAVATIAASMLMVLVFSVQLLAQWLPSSRPVRLGSTSAVESGTPIPITKSMAGRWGGTVQQGSGRYRVRLTLTRGALPGSRAGTVSYPKLGCSGTLTREPDRGVAGWIVVRENITDDPKSSCVRIGWISLERHSGTTLAYRWYGTADLTAPEATAALTK